MADSWVALLAEGVDRNWDCYEVNAIDPVVALLAEGVDRNYGAVPHDQVLHQSPSSRRAWIEISGWGSSLPAAWSSSSRRAWIEIRIAMT